jgi:hypothetical protein
MNEQEICRLYTEDKLTLRQIADIFDTNHHMIHRILDRHEIEVTTKGRKRKAFSDEHRRHLSESTKGRTSWITGKKMDEAYCRTNMKGRSHANINFDKYENYERLLFLKRILSKRRKYLGSDDQSIQTFLDRFYFDIQFNLIYDRWVISKHNRWYRPTLDHKVSQANGGNWEIDNLQFLTWFENRAKADMNEDEWQRFLIATNTYSDLFIRSTNGQPN